jgi:hypothetical protein
MNSLYSLSTEGIVKSLLTSDTTYSSGPLIKASSSAWKYYCNLRPINLSTFFRPVTGLLPAYPGVYHFRGVWILITLQIVYVVNILTPVREVVIWLKRFFPGWCRGEARPVLLRLVLHSGNFGLSGLRALSTSLSRSLSKSLWLRGNVILTALLQDNYFLATRKAGK